MAKAKLCCDKQPCGAGANEMNATIADIIDRLAQAGLKPPRLVTLAVTNQCNLHCRHCWPDSGPGNGDPSVPKDQVLRLIADFSALGAKKFVITGGEPLTHPDWFEILDFAGAQPNVREVRLQTNATLLTPVHVEAFLSLKDRGLIIQTSLEGATAQTHDYVRGQGSFHQTLQGLRRLKEGGMAHRICVTFTEMQHNFGDIPNLLEMVDAMGVGQFVTGTLVLGGRAVESDGLSAPTAQQYETLLSRYQHDQAFRDRYLRIGNIAAVEWSRTETQAMDGCCTFIETPYVTSDGRLYPCVMLHAESYAATDVYTLPLTTTIAANMDSWARLQQIKKSRVSHLDACNGCRDYARCGAGCMGRAYTAYKDFYAVEDRCRLRKAIYRHKTGGGGDKS
jgi:radical SAM protein with 4Fe4S-binding SPASM domain